MNSPIPSADNPDAEDLHSLRKAHYNATLSAVTQIHDDLQVMRVVTDHPFPSFQPGQYVALGLGNWEPRVTGVDEEHLDAVQTRHLVKRAYSISCSLLDSSGRLVRANECPYLEFYVSLVRHAAAKSPALTPRLFALGEGGRLFVEAAAKGHYTLDGVGPDDDVVFLATGTGEAPHNAMIAELLARSHRGRIVAAVSVRFRKDEAYRAAHEELRQRYPKYRYFVFTTRELENLDSGHPQFVGKCYLQGQVASGKLERMAGLTLDPERTHVFLCGSPAMIGLQDGKIVAGGMLEVLSERGFRLDQPHCRGNVHMERYW